MWQTIWSICLIASLAAFAIIAVLVTIGGARDLRRMLKKLE